MPLDPMIAGGFRGIELQNPLEAYGRIAQIQQAQQQNQLAALKMDEYRRGLAEQNALRTAIRPDFDPTNPAHQAELYKAAPTLAAGVIEKAMLTRKTAGEIGKTQAETEKSRAEVQDKQMRALGIGLTNVLRDPSDAALAQAFDTLEATGVKTAPFRAQFAQVADPEIRRQLIMNYATSHPEGRAAIEFTRPKPEKVDLKDRVAFIDMNPNSPTYGRETRPTEKVGTAPSLKTPEEERQAIRIAQASRPPEAPTITTIVDPKDPNRMLTIDARRYRGGTFGDPGVVGIAGKEPSAALRVNKIEQGKSAVSDVLDTIRGEYQKLDAARAIPSTQRDVLSNLTASAQASGVGQVLGRIGGTEEQASRDVIKSSRLMLLNAIKQATGLGAQQLNSNVELQTWLSAISDPTQSVEAVDAILDNIDRFVGSGGKYSARKSGGAVTPAAGPGAAPATAPAGTVMYATNPKTKERIMSTDGGNTWSPAR